MSDNEIRKSIRKEVLKKRDSINPALRKVKDLFIRQRLFSLPEFINAKTIFFYAAFRSEVETLGMIRASLEWGKKIVLPKVDTENRRLKLYEIRDVNELMPGCMGIPEPSVPEERLRGLDDIDLVVIPGAGFDVCGNRLGYGAGYYDILLAQMKKKISIVAPAYEEQIVERIPAAEHDVRIDKIVTDERVVECDGY